MAKYIIYTVSVCSSIRRFLSRGVLLEFLILIRYQGVYMIKWVKVPYTLGGKARVPEKMAFWQIHRPCLYSSSLSVADFEGAKPALPPLPRLCPILIPPLHQSTLIRQPFAFLMSSSAVTLHAQIRHSTGLQYRNR